MLDIAIVWGVATWCRSSAHFDVRTATAINTFNHVENRIHRRHRNAGNVRDRPDTKLNLTNLKINSRFYIKI